MKHLKKFNESQSDYELYVIIKLEEIQKKLKRGINSLRIVSESPIIYEFLSGDHNFERFDRSRSPGHGHYEKVQISIDDKIEFKWVDVIDTENSHYTPKSLSFPDIDDALDFLDQRYWNHGWSMNEIKMKAKRYFTNDGVDEIPWSER